MIRKLLLVSMLFFIGYTIYLDKQVCNKSGSIADKIKWANHKTCKGN